MPYEHDNKLGISCKLIFGKASHFGKCFWRRPRPKKQQIRRWRAYWPRAFRRRSVVPSNFVHRLRLKGQKGRERPSKKKHGMQNFNEFHFGVSKSPSHLVIPEPYAWCSRDELLIQAGVRLYSSIERAHLDGSSVRGACYPGLVRSIRPQPS